VRVDGHSLMTVRLTETGITRTGHSGTNGRSVKLHGVGAPISPARRPPSDDPGFQAACRLAAWRLAVWRSLATAGRAAAPRRSDLRCALAWLRSLPVVTAVVPRDHPEMSRHLTSRFTGRRLGVARAVLEIPSSTEEYLRGRRKQAMRTNVRRARDMGCTATVVSGPESWAMASDPDVRAMTSTDPSELVIVATQTSDLHRPPRAIVVTSVEGQWAHIKRFVTIGPRGEALMSRHLVQLALVDELRARDVRFLHAGTALSPKPHVRYAQYLAGFDVVNVRVHPVGSTSEAQGALRRLLATSARR
jgi:hypothetical protein